MKIIQRSRILSLTFALGVLAGSVATSLADETTPTPVYVAKVIQLNGINSAMQSVTVWVPVAVSKTAPETAKTAGTAKVIELPAANGPTRSVTVLIPTVKNDFYVAPLK